MDTLPTIDEMRRAYLDSDPAYNGVFFLGVKTTGIFCRPTCRARKPLPKNVEFHRTAKAAMAAGFRPCKRCRPLEWDDGPGWASRLLRELESDPARRISEQGLRDRGIDPATARRYFLKRYGMTFQAFARARRLSRALHTIREGGAIDAASEQSGYESLSGFRDAFSRFFGEAPGKARGKESVFLSWVTTPLGPMVAGATREGLCLLEFTDRRMLETQLATVSKRFGSNALPGSNEHLERIAAEMEDYFGGRLKEFSVPVVHPGSPFQMKVWEELRKIPYGEVRSYEDIARAIGDPKAVRAVGHANGLNRIAIVIPCHRVVRKGGALGGYGGGLARKQYLLDLERGGSLLDALA
jgi:AraC family transcriptional regulator of adaptative response/methylated-DNA-[protein]-cysteine methyltransferase